MKLFDSHSHLNDEKYSDDIRSVIEKIKRRGLDNFITAGFNLETSASAIRIAGKIKNTYATCGISPNDVPQSEDELWKMLEELEKMLQTGNKIVAVGEIGLDYHWNTENKEIQKIAFVEQIKLAKKYNLPIAVHTREAVDDTLEILRDNYSENDETRKGMFHCCPLNRELVKQGLQLGFYISFAGPVTFKNSPNAEEIVNMVPIDKMLIETDSPYLTPEPFRGIRNDPTNVEFIAKKIAGFRKTDVETIANATYENAIKFFGIKSKTI